MLSIGLCVLAFVACLLLGRRSLGLGTAAALAAGYSYGILRANVFETFSFFVFDAASAGLYLAAWTRSYGAADRVRVASLMRWILALTVWPCLLFLLPIQDPLVQLVGLRSAAFFLPTVLIGALMSEDDLKVLALCVAALNLVVFGFALAEYWRGIAAFFPRSAVTRILYLERDAVKGNWDYYRIPATFATPAGYGATMVMSLPLLIAAWFRIEESRWLRWLLTSALGGSIVGVFLSASRSQAAIACILAIGVTLSGRVAGRKWLAWLLIVAAVAWVVSSSNRLQRFTELEDTDMVGERMSASFNSSFLTLAEEYPLGNGLGGGGTSIPYFLQDRLRNQVGMENEYARIMLEEGIPGLLLWIAFIAWVLTRRGPPPDDPWFLARRLGRYLCLAYFATAFLGVGLLTAVPNAAMLLMYTGLIAAPAQHPVPSIEESKSAMYWRLARRRYGW
jgi:O-Antigen ligase